MAFAYLCNTMHIDSCVSSQAPGSHVCVQLGGAVVGLAPCLASPFIVAPYMPALQLCVWLPIGSLVQIHMAILHMYFYSVGKLNPCNKVPCGKLALKNHVQQCSIVCILNVFPSFWAMHFDTKAAAEMGGRWRESRPPIGAYLKAICNGLPIKRTLAPAGQCWKSSSNGVTQLYLQRGFSLPAMQHLRDSPPSLRAGSHACAQPLRPLRLLIMSAPLVTSPSILTLHPTYNLQVGCRLGAPTSARSPSHPCQPCQAGRWFQTRVTEHACGRLAVEPQVSVLWCPDLNYGIVG